MSQGYPAYQAQRILLIRPSVGTVKDVDGSRLDIFRLHYLDVHAPLRVISLFDGIKQVLDVIVGLRACEANSGIGVHGLDAIFGLEVPLYVYVASILKKAIMSINQRACWDWFTYGFVQGVGVDAKAIDVPQRRRDTSLAK